MDDCDVFISRGSMAKQVGKKYHKLSKRFSLANTVSMFKIKIYMESQ